MKTYVVIPHYIIDVKLVELAKNTIKSFRDTSDVIIISCDDASPYDSSFLKDISDVYIRNKKNKGFAGNCNVGFNWILKNEKEKCYVVCANNDIEVFDGWLEEFDRTLEIWSGDMVGGLGYKTRTIGGRPIEEYSINSGSLYFKRDISEGGRYDDWLFPGGFWLMKKSVLEDVGLLDEGFKHGGYEDIDFFLRAKKAGKKLLMTPKVAYWHQEGATRFSEIEKGHQYNVEPINRQYFKDKHGFDAHEKMNEFLIDNRISY